MEDDRGLDRAEAIADMRFHFILKTCAETVVNHTKARNIREAAILTKY